VLSFVLQVLLGLLALLAEPLLQALLCAHQGLTGLSGDVSSLVDDCRRELRYRQAAEDQQASLDSHQDTGASSSASGVTDSEAGTGVHTAAADDMEVDADSPLRSCSGHFDSDAVCGADENTAMEDAAEGAGEQAAAGGAWHGAGDGCTHAVAVGQSGGGSAGTDEGSEGLDEDSDSLGNVEAPEDAEQGMDDETVSGTPKAVPAEAAAGREVARVTARPGVSRAKYTEEEQAVMRELNISSLMHITPVSQRTAGWRVRLRAAGLKEANGE
jgi:hypothetical protein